MRMPFDQKELELITKVKAGEIPYKGTFIKNPNVHQITVTFSVTDPLVADIFLAGMYHETISKDTTGFCGSAGVKIKEVGMSNHNAFDAVRAMQPIIDSVMEYEDKMNQILTTSQSK